MSNRIDELRWQFGGKRPRKIPVEILREMLETPYEPGDRERTFRLGILGSKSRGVVISAVRVKCLDCCCWSTKEVELCDAVRCPLWPFRMGENPFRAKHELSESQQAALQKARGLA